MAWPSFGSGLTPPTVVTHSKNLFASFLGP